MVDRIYAPWRYEYLADDHSKDECVFCTLAKTKEDEKRWIIRRGKYWYVVLNIYPYTNGHLMIVSNRHTESFNSLSKEEVTEFMELLLICEAGIKRAYNPNGINIGANLGRSAGAGIVGHLHVHAVPRWHGDVNFMTAVGETRVVSEGLEQSFQKLKDAIG
jgi:ATP adenylyltransferase